jgi:leucyl aminopeptidase
MNDIVKIAFGPIAAPRGGTLVVFVGADLRPGERARALLAEFAARIESAAKTAGFRGKALTALDILEPSGLEAARLLVVGVAPGKDGKPLDFAVLGGFVSGKLGKSKAAAAVFESPAEPWDAGAAAEFALGVRLRAYRFEKYKTKKNDSEANGDEAPLEVVVGVEDATAARAAYVMREAAAEGVELARDLVNEPPNVLFPESFAERAGALRSLGVEVEILDEKAMTKLGMGALLGVGQGSDRESRLVAMRWRGSKTKKSKPVAFVGKGVCFDSGGISIKPAAGHGGHEGRHGRRGLRCRPHARAGPPEGQGQRRRCDRSGRKHA